MRSAKIVDLRIPVANDMKKLIIPVCIYIFLTTNVSLTHASSLFVVGSDGSVRKNVLGDSIDLSGAVEKVSRKVATAAIDGVKEIALEEIENKTHVKIESVNDSEEQVLGDHLIDILTIEGDLPSEKIAVQKETNGFSISQGGVTAFTNLAIHIIPETQKVLVESTQGSVEVFVLPAKVLQIVARANIINVFPESGAISLEEHDKDIQYVIKGEKAVTLFHVTRVVVPVETKVSAQTGLVIEINQPQWLNVLGFLAN